MRTKLADGASFAPAPTGDGGHGAPGTRKRARRTAKPANSSGEAGSMRLVEKVIRVVTIPAVLTGAMVLILYAATGAMPLGDFIVSEVCLLLVPALAYPVSEIFHLGKNRRDGQRSSAFAFSLAGYLGGFAWALLAHSAVVTKVLFASYLISVAALILFNKVLKFKASGHACSATAPAVLLTWQISPWALLPCALIIAAVYYASIRLGEHTPGQLAVGSSISALAGILSILIF